MGCSTGGGSSQLGCANYVPCFSRKMAEGLALAASLGAPVFWVLTQQERRPCCGFCIRLPAASPEASDK